MIRNMNPFDIIHQYFAPTDLSYQILVQHSTLVTARAIAVARAWNIKYPEQLTDLQFIAEAWMLHDIGIGEVNDPEIGCFGTHPYIYHIVAWYHILMHHNLPRHARVAISHTGVGIFHEQIRERNMPLPLEFDYFPHTIEEKIISYADLFYSKVESRVLYERSKEEARMSVSKFGDAYWKIFDERDVEFSL